MKNAKQQQTKQKLKQSRWRRQKQAPAKQRRYFETGRQLQADPRMGKNGITHRLELENQTMALVQPVTVNQAVLEEWARGFVMKACEKGFLTLAESTSYVYYAYRYTVSTMIALITNQVQLTIKVPYALLATCRALQGKKAPMSNGTVSYTVVTDDVAASTVTKIVGYQPYGYLWSSGVPTNTLVNVYFPILNNVIPGYTEELGSQAFQRLCQILVEGEEKGPFRMVQISEPTTVDKDVSAFSYARGDFEKIGLTSSGVLQGGFSTSLNLEVPIFRPQFGALGVEGFVEAQVQRFGNLHANCAGDATFLAAGMATWFSEDKWRMQRPPKLHPIDFNEFGDVVGKWVSGIQQAFVNDVLAGGGIITPTILTAIQCPLTLQETCLILRNVLMQAFKNTQAGCHAVYPIVPLSDNDNAFVPFVVGTNTCYLTANDMSLPVPLLENIRSLVDRFIHRGNGDDWEIFYPVLGIWAQEVLAEADYSFLVGETPQPSFKSSALLAKKKIVTKEGTAFAPLVETVISLVDGQSPGGQVCINDPNALKTLTSFWENWLKESGLSTFSCPVGVLGTELGINALTSINMTRVCGALPDEERKAAALRERSEQMRFIEDERRSKKGTLSISAIYEDQDVVIDNSQSKLLATAYEEIQSIWILPCMRTRLDGLNIITPLRWAAIEGEPYANIRLNGDVGPTLNELHSTYASKMVRSKLQPPTDWDELFSDLAKKGRGGILSGLVGRFADMIIPGAGNIVNQIGGAIGV